jgi:hypothetical protein
MFGSGGIMSFVKPALGAPKRGDHEGQRRIRVGEAAVPGNRLAQASIHRRR